MPKVTGLYPLTGTPTVVAPTPTNTTKPTASTSQPGAATTPAVGGTGIGVLAIAGLGAIALANTKVGPVVVAALVAAVIWNGNALVGVIGGKASGISLGGAAGSTPAALNTSIAPGPGQLAPGFTVQPA